MSVTCVCSTSAASAGPVERGRYCRLRTDRVRGLAGCAFRPSRRGARGYDLNYTLPASIPLGTGALLANSLGHLIFVVLAVSCRARAARNLAHPCDCRLSRGSTAVTASLICYFVQCDRSVLVAVTLVAAATITLVGSLALGVIHLLLQKVVRWFRGQGRQCSDGACALRLSQVRGCSGPPVR